MVYSKSKERGFTIVELMIAVSIFAIAITLVLAGVIFIARQYQQASNRVAMEDATRNLHQQIIQSVQFGKIIIPDAGKGLFTNSGYRATCVGNYMYIYGEAKIVDQSSYEGKEEGLYIKDNTTGCAQADISKVNARNLLPPGAKVVEFSVSDQGEINTTVANSPPDLLEIVNSGGSFDVSCKSAITGREFCAIVSLNSAANQRIK